MCCVSHQAPQLVSCCVFHPVSPTFAPHCLPPFLPPGLPLFLPPCHPLCLPLCLVPRLPACLPPWQSFRSLPVFSGNSQLSPRCGVPLVFHLCPSCFPDVVCQMLSSSCLKGCSTCCLLSLLVIVFHLSPGCCLPQILSPPASQLPPRCGLPSVS